MSGRTDTGQLAARRQLAAVGRARANLAGWQPSVQRLADLVVEAAGVPVSVVSLVTAAAGTGSWTCDAIDGAEPGTSRRRVGFAHINARLARLGGTASPVVQYLLTGTAWQVTEGAGEAILGGTEIGEDGGYGPARLLDAATVRRVAVALDALDVGALCARYDPAAMAAADIYPNNLTIARDEVEGFLTPYVEGLRLFYGTAAADGQAVLLAIV